MTSETPYNHALTPFGVLSLAGDRNLTQSCWSKTELLLIQGAEKSTVDLASGTAQFRPPDITSRPCFSLCSYPCCRLSSGKQKGSSSPKQGASWSWKDREESNPWGFPVYSGVKWQWAALKRIVSMRMTWLEFWEDHTSKGAEPQW